MPWYPGTVQPSGLCIDDEQDVTPTRGAGRARGNLSEACVRHGRSARKQGSEDRYGVDNPEKDLDTRKGRSPKTYILENARAPGEKTSPLHPSMCASWQAALNQQFSSEQSLYPRLKQSE